jgi:hypothetical protein
VRMIPWYCLPCPRASMAARNSFLSWISFTTGHRRRAVSAQGTGGPQDSCDGCGVVRCCSGWVVVLCQGIWLSCWPHPILHTPPPPYWLTFFKPIQLRGWILLLHRGCFSFLFLWILPSGKDILESPFFLFQISCRGPEVASLRHEGCLTCFCQASGSCGEGFCTPSTFSPGCP